MPTPAPQGSSNTASAYLSDGSEDWQRLKYHPSYTSYYDNNQPIQTWFYSNGASISDSFIVNYYRDGTVRSVHYYGEGGDIYWYRTYDSGGTLTKYVMYDESGTGHFIVDDGTGHTIDTNPLIPPM
jgi:antitoxin component YwqK of YwqJK toxin-antitoxin module